MGDWTYPFHSIASTLRSADLAFDNLEGPVSDTGRDLHHLYSFRADPRAMEGLQYAGFRVMSVANNYMDHWDRPALLDTLQRLRTAAILPVGRVPTTRKPTARRWWISATRALRF